MKATIFITVLCFVGINFRAEAVQSFSPPTWAAGFNHASYERGAILDANNYVLYWGVNSDTKEIKFAAIVKAGTTFRGCGGFWVLFAGCSGPFSSFVSRCLPSGRGLSVPNVRFD